tara:strand:- start:775 stop:996 length:222 start_codon:yes stop_codon:yes gene_type:complete
MKTLIEQLRIKADSCGTNTKLERCVKGAYVDALIIAKDTEEQEGRFYTNQEIKEIREAEHNNGKQYQKLLKND